MCIVLEWVTGRSQQFGIQGFLEWCCCERHLLRVHVLICRFLDSGHKFLIVSVSNVAGISKRWLQITLPVEMVKSVPVSSC